MSKKNGVQIPLVLPNDNGIRPAGEPDACFYCRQKVGQPHQRNCVILSRKVKVKYTYEVEIEVPWDWDKEMIEFSRNLSSWCADNSLDELSEYAKQVEERGECLCGVFEAEAVEIPDAPPYRKNDKDEIVP